MSQKELCASCTSFSIDSPMLSSSSKKPKWLDEKDFVEDFIESQKVFKLHGGDGQSEAHAPPA